MSGFLALKPPILPNCSRAIENKIKIKKQKKLKKIK